MLKKCNKIIVVLTLVVALLASSGYNFVEASTSGKDDDCACNYAGLIGPKPATEDGLTQQDINRMQKEIKKNGGTYTIGLNSATIYPLDKLCGAKPSMTAEAFGGNPTLPAVKAVVGLPSSYDLRSKGGVTPVKNQGGCGSCWAFATIGSAESAIKLATNNTLDLSEQYLVSCNNDGWGCNGGNCELSMVKTGVPSESAMPYTATDGYCKSVTKPHKIDDWGYVTSSWGSATVDQIKTAIYQHGAVYALVAADSYFSGYTGGVFNNTTSTELNHAIVLVGWDDSKNSWILRNSWGNGWGENGYMYIGYGVNKVGYGAAYSVVNGSPDPQPDPDPQPQPDGKNLALNKPTSASASYSSTYDSSNAVDADANDSRWVTEVLGNDWITVDLQGNKTVSEMQVKWSATNYPKSYKVFVIDPSTGQWKVVKTVSSDGNSDTIKFATPVYGRTFSLNLASANASYYCLYDWKVFGEGSPSPDPDPEPEPQPQDTNVALNKPTSASASYSSTYDSSNAVDADANDSRWVTEVGSNNWITVDLQGNKTVSEMQMKWSATNYPKNYTVYVIDPSTGQWKSVQTVSSDGNSDTIKFATPVYGRKFSLNLASPNASYYCLYDWKVMGR